MALGTLQLGIGAELGSAMSGLDGLSDKLKNLGGTSDDTASKLSNIAGGSSGGGGMMSALKGIPPQAALVGAAIAGIGVAAYKLTSTLIGLTMNTAAVGDELDKTSQRLGTSVADLQKLRLAADMSGTSAAGLEKGLAMANAAIAGAGKEGKKTAAEIERMGVSLKNSDGSAKSSGQVMKELAGEFKNLDSDAARSAKAAAIFGKKIGPDLLLTLKQGGDGIGEMSKDLEELGGIMSDDSVKSAAALTDAMTRINRMIDGVKNKIGAVFMPAATEVINGITDLGKVFISLLPQGDGMSKMLQNLAQRGVLFVVDGLTQAAQSTLNFIQTIKPAIPAIAGVGKVVVALGKGWMVWIGVLNNVSRVIRGFIGTVLSALLRAVGDVAGKIADLAEWAGMDKLSAGVRSVSGAYGGLAQTLETISFNQLDKGTEGLAKLKEEAASVGDVFSMDLAGQIDKALEGLSSGAEGAIERLEALRDRLRNPEAVTDTPASSGGPGGAAEEELEVSRQKLAVEKEIQGLTVLQEEILLRKIELLYVEDELRRNELEFELAIMELEEKGLEGLAASLELQKIILAYDNEKNDILEKRLALLDAENEKQAETTEQAKDYTATLNTSLNSLQSMAGAIDRSTNSAGKLSKVFSKMIPILQSAVALKAALGDPMAIAAVAAGLVGTVAGMVGNKDSDRTPATASGASKQRESENMAQAFAKAFVDEQEARMGPRIDVRVDARGALIGDENEVSRRLTDLVMGDLNSRGGAPGFAGGL